GVWVQTACRSGDAAVLHRTPTDGRGCCRIAARFSTRLRQGVIVEGLDPHTQSSATGSRMSSPQIISTVSRELSLAPTQVANTLALFAEGNTLPFIARYRKEVTGGLDEVQLRDVRDRTQYLTELDERRATMLKHIE